MGKSFFTPKYIGQPYTTISGKLGNKITYHALYNLGYNHIHATDFCLGIKKLASNIDSNGNVDVVNGSIDCSDCEVIDYDSTTQNVKLEIQTSSECSGYDEKVVQQDFNQELLYPNGVEHGLILNLIAGKFGYKCEVELQIDGLFKKDSNGNDVNHSVGVLLEYSLDGGNTFNNWGSNPFVSNDTDVVNTSYNNSTGICTFNGKSYQVMRFVATKTFSYSDVANIPTKCIEFRIQRTTEKSLSVEETDTITLNAIRTWCYDPDLSETQNVIVKQSPIVESDRHKLTRVYFEITLENNIRVQEFKEFNCMVQSLGRTWNDTTREWSNELSETCNPASIALLSLQSVMRGDEVYDDSELDLESFGEFYEWCENNPYEIIDEYGNDIGFTCNGVLTSKVKTSDLLSDILACGRGYKVVNGNKIGVEIEKAQSESTLVINNQNVIDASNQRSFDEEISGFEIVFNNRMNYDQQDSFYLLYEGKSPTDTDFKTKKVNFNYQTVFSQIWKNGWFYLKKLKAQRELWARVVTSEGNKAQIGKLVSVQDDTILVGIGDGAEITELVYDDEENPTEIIGIKTDGEFFVDDITKSYGVEIQETDQIELKITTELVDVVEGENNDFTFQTPISLERVHKPCVGDIISFGESGKISQDCIVVKKEEKGDGTFELYMYPYVESVYSDDRNVENYDTKMTVPKSVSKKVVSDESKQIDLKTKSEIQQVQTALTTKLNQKTNNHVVTLYRKSTTNLTRSDLPSLSLIYNFSTNTISWSGGTEENWKTDYDSANSVQSSGTMYVTTAVAFGSGVTDYIEPAEWATPVAYGQNGENGYNTFTIQLFKRSADVPNAPSGSITYTFNHNSGESGLSGDLENWSESIPESTTDNLPCWEIHATALSNTLTDTITNWSTPAKILSDSEVTMADVENAINKSAPPPTVTMSKYYVGIQTDEDSVSLCSQTFSVDISVKQTKEELDFSFGTITVPDGVTYSIRGKSIDFTVETGAVISEGQIDIEVIYRPYLNNNIYANANNNDVNQRIYISGGLLGDYSTIASLPTASEGDIINWIGSTTQSSLAKEGQFDENTAYIYNDEDLWEVLNIETNAYGYSELSSSSDLFVLGLGYSQVKGGRKLGGIDDTSDIPTNVIMGDYFVWSGTDDTSYESLTLKSGVIYRWTGVNWEVSNTNLHIGNCIKEILDITNSVVKQNNTDAVSWVRTLVASDIFCENINVSNQAIINKLAVADIVVGQTGSDDGTIKSWNYSSSNNSGFLLRGKDGYAELNNVKVRGNIVASSLTLSQSCTVGSKLTIDVNGKITASDVNISGTVNASSGSFTGSIRASSLTLTQNCTVGTKLTLGTDGKITASDVSLSGSITATSGRFSAGLGDLTEINVPSGQIINTRMAGFSYYGELIFIKVVNNAPYGYGYKVIHKTGVYHKEYTPLNGHVYKIEEEYSSQVEGVTIKNESSKPSYAINQGISIFGNGVNGDFTLEVIYLQYI